MNPPDYYPVPAEVLEAAERAFIKYMSSEDVDPDVKEKLANVLMGEKWPTNGVCTGLSKGNRNMYLAILYLLPASDEDRNKKTALTHSSNMESALRFLNAYLNEPS